MAQTHMANQRVLMHKSSRSGTWMFTQLVYWIAGAVEIALAFRFGLRLFGANPDAGFVQFIYGITGPFMAPFETVFGVNSVEGSVFEWSVLLAVAVYAIVAWGIVALIESVAPKTSKSVDAVEEVREHEQTPSDTTVL